MTYLESIVGASRLPDGTGSNPDHPDFGAAGQILLRLADPDYDDGIGTLAESGRPNVREISNIVVAQDESIENSVGASMFLVAWGQFIDHDINHTPPGSTEIAMISIPDDDPVFAPGSLMPFTRVDPEAGTGADEPRQYANEITAFIDGSMIYGSDAATAAVLRDDGGKILIDGDGYLQADGNGDLMTGDSRAAENALLTAMHTVFAREHNRWVDVLAERHPELTNDELYTAARNRVEAELQAITFNEYLPVLLGKDAMSAYSGFDSTVNPGVSVEFSTAVYRFGHSLLNDTMQRLDEDGETHKDGDLDLIDAFFAPEMMEGGGIDAILRGAADSPTQEVDTQVVEALRSALFGTGLDLAAFNLQRGRDLGVASYNDLRAAVGLERASSFADVTSDPELAAKLEELYGEVDGLDAWVGGLAEDHVNGGMLGELFATILIDQFARIRDGDPFWSQAGHLAQSEIDDLWSTTLADVIERNTGIDDIQDNLFIAYNRIGGNKRDNELNGGKDHDLIIGFDGDDVLMGKDKDDQLVGGRGKDTLIGGTGDDILEGGKGSDKAWGQDGNDVIRGQAGKDELHGGTGDDIIKGGDDADLIYGSSGKDVISGGSGKDTIDGGDGKDWIDGGKGGDKIEGGGSADIIDGGKGEDWLAGGGGGDQFRFTTKLSETSNVDTIDDFKVGSDTIGLLDTKFSALGAAVDAGELRVGKSAKDSDDHLIYRADKGKLYYDPDGKGGESKILFAKLDKDLSLSETDFDIISA